MIETIIAIIAAIVAAFGIGRWQGGANARNKADAERNEAAAKSHETRKRIEHEIDQDDDLYRRARDSGVVRREDQ